MGRVLKKGSGSLGASGPSGHSFDRWCNIAAQLSQVLLLGLGVFGYFYTVLPVYQKAVLDEDIAQKTLEVRQQERRIGELNKQIASREDALSAKNSELAAKDRDLSEVRTQATAAKAEARTNYTRLRSEYIGSAMAALRNCPSPFFKREPDGAELLKCPEYVSRRVGPLLAQLRREDSQLLTALLGKYAAESDAEYQKLVSKYRMDVERVKSEIDRLQREMDESKATGEKAKNEGKPFPPGYFTGSAGLFSAWSKAFLGENEVRANADSSYRKILDDVGGKVLATFFEKALP